MDAVVIQFANTSGGKTWGEMNMTYKRIVKILIKKSKSGRAKPLYIPIQLGSRLHVSKERVMIKKLLKLLVIAPLLMAFQCEEDLLKSTLEFNDYRVQITPLSSFSLSDTIWIAGRVSSQVYDLSINDSIFNEDPQVDVFSIYKLVKPDQVSNCKDAIDKFELLFDTGEFSYLSACENALLNALPALDNSGSFYTYKIGLRPKFVGDYVLSWQSGIIQNENRNEFIVDDYPIENHPKQIGFNSCGSVSWRYVNESEKEYFFRVE
jgi:hypothetical protein